MQQSQCIYNRGLMDVEELKTKLHQLGESETWMVLESCAGR